MFTCSPPGPTRRIGTQLARGGEARRRTTRDEGGGYPQRPFEYMHLPNPQFTSSSQAPALFSFGRNKIATTKIKSLSLLVSRYIYFGDGMQQPTLMITASAFLPQACALGYIHPYLVVRTREGLCFRLAESKSGRGTLWSRWATKTKREIVGCRAILPCSSRNL